MKKDYKYRWLEEDYNSAKKKNWISSSIHFVLLFVLFFATSSSILESSRFMILGISFALITGATLLYKFDSFEINVALLVSLFGLLALEIFWVGIPNLSPYMTSTFIEKGILMDLVLVILPYLYIALRAVSIWPLLNTIQYQRKLNAFS